MDTCVSGKTDVFAGSIVKILEVTLSHLLTWVLNYAIFDEPEKKKNMSRCIEFIFSTKHIVSQ